MAGALAGSGIPRILIRARVPSGTAEALVALRLLAAIGVKASASVSTEATAALVESVASAGLFFNIWASAYFNDGPTSSTSDLEHATLFAVPSLKTPLAQAAIDDDTRVPFLTIGRRFIGGLAPHIAGEEHRLAVFPLAWFAGIETTWG